MDGASVPGSRKKFKFCPPMIRKVRRNPGGKVSPVKVNRARTLCTFSAGFCYRVDLRQIADDRDVVVCAVYFAGQKDVPNATLKALVHEICKAKGILGPSDTRQVG